MTYVPERGELVWLSFDPQAGQEQAGYRLALVLSPRKYNRLTSLMLCCPLTTSIKGNPFEVSISVGGKPGVVLADQVKSLAWRVCKTKPAGTVEQPILNEVLGKIEALLT